ncbi:MAG: RHS repeat-associated core domain-containing protein, partial [Pyrinomonadaceae bacterium]
MQTRTATGSYENRASNFTYLAHGGVSSLMLGNNRWENAQYNNRLQVTQVGMGTSSADTSLLKIDYNYGTSSNNNGSLQSQTIAFTGYSGTISQSYVYDNLNRIQSATENYAGGQSWKESFSYDRFGNRRFDAANTTTIAGCPQNVCNPTINQANNRIDAGQGVSYDQGGNVMQDAGGQRFSYDAENHQIGFFAGNNGGSTPNATYFYDGDGRRVRKIDGTRETVFVYNASGSLIAEYETNFTPAAATTKYLTQDHLGSPRVITDQNGAIVSRHDYRAFGEEVYSGTANRSNTQGYGQADGIRKQYTGYERDYESGLDFAQARYYNSKLGRFTSVDPLT